MDRLQEEVRQILAGLFLFEVQDPSLREVIVTRVKVTRDLGLARIYFELTDRSQRAKIEGGLARAKGYVRRRLAERLNLRLTPQIEFIYDETSEEFERIEGLFPKE